MAGDRPALDVYSYAVYSGSIISSGSEAANARLNGLIPSAFQSASNSWANPRCRSRSLRLGRNPYRYFTDGENRWPGHRVNSNMDVRPLPFDIVLVRLVWCLA